MTGQHHYHAIVWIDHHEARVFYFGRNASDEVLLHPKHPVRHIHHKANSIGSGHTSEDHDFFRHVADALSNAGAVLVTGPSNAKVELKKYIQHENSALASRIAGIQTLDHPTDGELLQFARRYFKAQDLMLP